MDRSTKRGEKGYAYFPKCFEAPCEGGGCKLDDCEFLAQVCDRLAAYEDTGLEPEEITEAANKRHDCKIDCLLEEYNALLETVNDLGGIDRLKELAQAKKYGRLVVLPCYTSDTVYMPFLGRILELEVGGIVLNGGVTMIYYHRTSIRSSPDDFGKAVFLTREEAEAALKGGSNETDI